MIFRLLMTDVGKAIDFTTLLAIRDGDSIGKFCDIAACCERSQFYNVVFVYVQRGVFCELGALAAGAIT